MKISILVVSIVIMCGFIFWKDIKSFMSTEKTKVKSEKSDSKKDEKKEQKEGSSEVTILERWDLPEDLKEVSGIAYIDEHRFACVQDENGIIFIYNWQDKKIERKIPFTETGDFEGITVKETTAYVVRADGLIYEVPLNGNKSEVKSYKTSLTVRHNIEGFCYDKNNNRLLLATKNDDPSYPGSKNIYAFSLGTTVLENKPVFKIDLEHPLFNNKGKKKKTFSPSAMAIHPTTNEFYITDGSTSMLMTMDHAGNMLKLYTLGGEFSQPEGITFSPKGELFISNEGTKNPGNILKVELN